MQVMRHILGKEQRNEVTKAITAVLFERQEIVFAFVLGSFLRGLFFRDIDLGIFVKGIDRADFWDYEAGIAQEIEETVSHRFLVEPKVINKAPLSFCYHVIRGQLLFSRDEELLVEFMVRVARGYLEMAPLRHRYIAEAMA